MQICSNILINQIITSHFFINKIIFNSRMHLKSNRYKLHRQWLTPLSHLTLVAKAKCCAIDAPSTWKFVVESVHIEECELESVIPVSKCDETHKYTTLNDFPAFRPTVVSFNRLRNRSR